MRQKNFAQRSGLKRASHIKPTRTSHVTIYVTNSGTLASLPAASELGHGHRKSLDDRCVLRESRDE